MTKRKSPKPHTRTLKSGKTVKVGSGTAKSSTKRMKSKNGLVPAAAKAPTKSGKIKAYAAKIVNKLKAFRQTKKDTQSSTTEKHKRQSASNRMAKKIKRSRRR